MRSADRINFRFVMVLVGFAGVVLLTYRDDVLQPVLAPLVSMTSQGTLALIHLSGLEAVRSGSILSHPNGFAYEIYYRCSGILPLLFLAVAISAYPARSRRKVVGLLVGVPILVAVNQLRLVHLFYVGIYHPASFDVVHRFLWQGAVISVTVMVWVSWARWVGFASQKGKGEAGSTWEEGDGVSF